MYIHSISTYDLLYYTDNFVSAAKWNLPNQPTSRPGTPARRLPPTTRAGTRRDSSSTLRRRSSRAATPGRPTGRTRPGRVSTKTTEDEKLRRNFFLGGGGVEEERCRMWASRRASSVAARRLKKSIVLTEKIGVPESNSECCLVSKDWIFLNLITQFGSWYC